MINVQFRSRPGGACRILCLGAHSDDIEIGCGGTILRLLSECPGSDCTWIVFSASGPRRIEARKSAGLFLRDAGRRRVKILGFRDGYFPYEGGRVKEYFDQMKKDVGDPDLILTHYRNDLHQDHRLISELTWNTFRNHLILEYEIIKYDGDLGVPNFFVHLDEGTCAKKVDYLRTSFATQRNKVWFSEDAFLSILRIRGIEASSPGRYAEAFYGRKITF